LKNNQIIQKVLTLVMLAIFTLSITPKKYVHDLITEHTDFYSFHPAHEVNVSQAGLSCHCEDLVVSAPFIPTSFETVLATELHYKEFITTPYYFFFYNAHTAKDLRGPPCLG
jgi:hypothetical protein